MEERNKDHSEMQEICENANEEEEIHLKLNEHI